MKTVRLILCLAFLSLPTWATTYYIDYVSGADTNNGTSTSTPWKHAPGMNGCTSNCNITPNPGDSIIFKGGITWTGTDSFTWTLSYSGSAGNPVYIGVSNTYYDTTKCEQVLAVTITNAGSGYSASSAPTPVFTAGLGSGAAGYTLINSSGGVAGVVMTNRGTGYSSSFSVTFSSGSAAGTATVNSGWCRPIFNGNNTNFGSVSGFNTLVYSRGNYLTFDNIEEIGMSAYPATISNAVNQLIAGSGSNQSEYNLFKNFYIHGWNTSVCVGTGNIAANASTITSFVPTAGECTSDISGYLTANSIPYSMPIQKFPQGSYWPVQSNAPVISAVSGSNPYTITTNSTTVGTACNSCLIVMGGAASMFAFYGNEGGNIGSGVLDSVIDGKDTLPVTFNPYPDCGASESLNVICIAPTMVAEWRGPQNWEGNTFQYIDNIEIGTGGMFDQNTVQYLRIGTNPTSHTNILEAIEDYPAIPSVIWNNLIWHTTMQNASAPNGQTTVGLSIQPSPNTGVTAYLFNNVISDTIVNTVIEYGATGGGLLAFNNTLDCGPEWSLSYNCIQTSTGGTTSVNNLYVTSNGSPYSGTVTHSGDVPWTPTTATAAGYTPTQSPYIYLPTSVNCGGQTPCTVGTGVSIATYCTTLSSIWSSNTTELAAFSNAGTACLRDTTYGATYDPVHNTSVAGNRISSSRSTSAPDVGAYEYAAATQASPATCTPTSGVVPQTVTCTNPNSGTTVACYTTNGSTPATNGAGTGCTTGTAYTTSLSISVAETLKIIAGTSTLTDSTVNSYTYTSGTQSNAIFTLGIL